MIVTNNGYNSYFLLLPGESRQFPLNACVTEHKIFSDLMPLVLINNHAPALGYIKTALDEVNMRQCNIIYMYRYNFS